MRCRFGRQLTRDPEWHADGSMERLPTVWLGCSPPRCLWTPEQAINKLREVEMAIGCTVAEAARVTKQAFYRWRTEYGGLRIDQARRLKASGIGEHISNRL